MWDKFYLRFTMIWCKAVAFRDGSILNNKMKNKKEGAWKVIVIGKKVFSATLAHFLLDYIKYLLLNIKKIIFRSNLKCFKKFKRTGCKIIYPQNCQKRKFIVGKSFYCRLLMIEQSNFKVLKLGIICFWIRNL